MTVSPLSISRFRKSLSTQRAGPHIHICCVVCVTGRCTDAGRRDTRAMLFLVVDDVLGLPIVDGVLGLPIIDDVLGLCGDVASCDDMASQ